MASPTDGAELQRMKSLSDILSSYEGTSDNLVKAIVTLGEATAHVSVILSNYVKHTYAGTQNASGDDQLDLDIDCDKAVFAAVRQSEMFTTAASEETPVETNVGTGPYSVAFDPLDGSSIIDANFSVGSIYGIWEGNSILGRTGRQQVSSAVALYGPRTTLCIALPSSSAVLEVTLVQNRTKWELSRPLIQLQPSGKIFAPGNLRASNDNAQYGALLQYWLQNRYTLRYTGGMVPDVYHIFVKSKGVFVNVSSEKAKAKLRLAYEVAPIGLIVECAGGKTCLDTEDKSVLDVTIDDLDQRCGVAFGSTDEVVRFSQYMFQETSKP
uniref:Fructose-bisphosphatase n=1 Tax=Eucampia antarctica TaxID=49252 RepID=A0A7S2QZP1_9STRA|mmetsp:Transcript_10841/g.10350  ORF Transcript_10841/g.10350 Transcript_10841/m.10350 type:complete len:325 (+) Transcript_10841:24-998(+)